MSSLTENGKPLVVKLLTYLIQKHSKAAAIAQAKIHSHSLRRTLCIDLARAQVRLDMDLPPDCYEMGAILDDIHRHKRQFGRPMLSPVVVDEETLSPGQGFLTLDRSLGLFVGDDRGGFHVQELRKVHDSWASH